jgi:hypothetical protein
MSDETEQGALIPDDAIPSSADSLGAAEWPAGEADEPVGEAQVVATDDDGHGAGTASAEEERLRADRETDSGEITPSDPASIEQGKPPANLAEPLR